MLHWVLSSAPDCQNRDLIGNGDKIFNEPELSYLRFALFVFDLLSDDGPSDNLEGSLVNEAHVAFVVEVKIQFTYKIGNILGNSIVESKDQLFIIKRPENTNVWHPIKGSSLITSFTILLVKVLLF
ncbi:hypothetical protein CsSME_00023299 [Camellia sinensis var. sinensis]